MLVDEIREMSRLHGCEHALGEALEALEEAQATIAILTATNASLVAVIAHPAHQPTRAVIRIGDQHMSAVTINVDTTNESAELVFEDDHGDLTAPPSGAIVAFSSSDPSVAITPDPSGAFRATVKPVTMGKATITAKITGADGLGIPGPDGKDFAVTPAEVDVVAGPASQVVLSVSGAPKPAPAPSGGPGGAPAPTTPGPATSAAPTPPGPTNAAPGPATTTTP